MHAVHQKDDFSRHPRHSFLSFFILSRVSPSFVFPSRTTSACPQAVVFGALPADRNHSSSARIFSPCLFSPFPFFVSFFISLLHHESLLLQEGCSLEQSGSLPVSVVHSKEAQPLDRSSHRNLPRKRSEQSPVMEDFFFHLSVAPSRPSSFFRRPRISRAVPHTAVPLNQVTRLHAPVLPVVAPSALRLYNSVYPVFFHGMCCLRFSYASAEVCWAS